MYNVCVYFLVIYICWSVSVRNSLESLGETFRAALQWSRRNSMAPVSGVSMVVPHLYGLVRIQGKVAS